LLWVNEQAGLDSCQPFGWFASLYQDKEEIIIKLLL
jgi:hypothetical protein